MSYVNDVESNVGMSIPKNIVQYWDQGRPPEDVEPLVDSWRELNFDFSYEIFDKNQARDFIGNVYGVGGVSVFDAAALPAMRSDIFRVAFILHRGGVYVDAATKCVSSIADLIDQSDKLTLMRKQHGRVWNGFIAAPAGSQCLLEIWRAICRNVEERKIPGVWGATGPGVYHKVVDSAPSDMVSMISEAEMERYFKLITGLRYKRSAHWSKVQHMISIYNSP